MKIWIKYLIGAVLGIAFAVLAPADSQFFNAAVEFASNLAIQFGRYSLLPVLFFGFTVSIFELRENKSLLRLACLTIIIIGALSLLLTFIGGLSVFIRNPPQIPIFFEGTATVQVIGIRDSLLALLPSSGFDALLNGTYILPLCIFGGFAGAGCAVDKSIAKPAVTPVS